MKKKLIIFLTIFFISTIKVNAGSGLIDIYSSNKSPVIGNTITITVNTSAATNTFVYQYTISYDSSKLKFESSSGNCQGLFCAGSSTSGKASDTLTFKVIGSGSTTVSAQAYSILLEDESEASTKVDAVTITGTTGSSSSSSSSNSSTTTTKKEYSTNNNLKSLSIEGYNISPEFNKDTLEYTVTIPNNIEKIKINAEAEDTNAKIEGLEEKEISEGDNKLEVIVTSEKGTTKTYIINAKVEDENPIEVTINNEKYTVIKRKSTLVAPNNYQEITVNINNIEIPAFTSEITKYVLVGLKDKDSNIALYIYNKDKNTYTKYQEINTNSLTIIPLTTNKKIDSTYKTKIKINKIEIDAYKYKSTSNYSYIYGKNIETGKENWYQYDEIENTLQIYNDEIINIYKDKIEKSNYLIYGLSGGILLLSVLLLITTFKKTKKKKIYKKIKEDNKIDIEQNEELKTNIITKEE